MPRVLKINNDASGLFGIRRNYKFGHYTVFSANSDIGPLASFQSVGSEFIRGPHGGPLERGKGSIYCSSEKYKYRENCHQRAGVFRVDDELPEYFHFLRWIFLVAGIIGPGLGGYGVALCQVGYCGGNSSILISGIILAASGWMLAICGPFVFFSQASSLRSLRHDFHVSVSVYALVPSDSRPVAMLSSPLPSSRPMLPWIP